MAENNQHLLEKICKRQLEKLDGLTLAQRFLIYQMLLLVKNGHTCKFTYKVPFNKIKDIQNKLAKIKAKNYTFKDCLSDFGVLSEKKLSFIEESGKKRECIYLENLNVDYHNKMIKYNFCKDMAKTCANCDGKNFIVQILDFVALETKASKRMFRFLTSLNNRTVTTHRVSSLLTYFFINEPMKTEDFFETAIKPSIMELNQKLLFTLKNISAKIINKGGEDFIEISFVPKRRTW